LLRGNNNRYQHNIIKIVKDTKSSERAQSPEVPDSIPKEECVKVENFDHINFDYWLALELPNNYLIQQKYNSENISEIIHCNGAPSAGETKSI